MQFFNSTELDSARLIALFETFSRPFVHEKLTVRVRYSRGADFSGRCYYADSRIFINLGRKNQYPYALGTHVARSRSNKRRWWREIYTVSIADPYQLALFIYMHEFFHFLVKAAGRCTRRKESMCDRFATRAMVDRLGCVVRDKKGRPAARGDWDITDLDRFVANAPREPERVVTIARPIYAAARVPVVGKGVLPPRIGLGREGAADVAAVVLPMVAGQGVLVTKPVRRAGRVAKSAEAEVAGQLVFEF